MAEDKIKVLYIAGPTRSGSTLLSNILGEIEGFFNAGELIDIWDRGLNMGGTCGCGAQVKSCQVWSEVLDNAFQGLTQENIQEMIYLRDSACHSFYVPWFMLIPGRVTSLKIRLNKFLLNLGKLYRLIQTSTKSRVIVDSSKNAGYAFLLGMMPEIDLHIIHLIRDPRATAYSWLRKKKGLKKANPIKTSLIWNSRNIVSEILGKSPSINYLRVYYEDFIAQPESLLKDILFLIKEKPSTFPFISSHEVKLGMNHSIYGNPNRFHSGVIRISPDNEWKEMNVGLKLIVTSLTWPLLLRHRYSVFSTKSSDFANHHRNLR